MPSPFCAVLQSNRLRVLPPELARCSRLVKLCVAHNQLSTLPQELVALRLLEDLDVSQ
jgi:Leucine-rich repeat (LRR) protein